MFIHECFEAIDAHDGQQDKALSILVAYSSPLTVKEIISRLTNPHLQPIKKALHTCLLGMVEGDAWLQQQLIDCFISADDRLQKSLMPVMAQLGAKALILETLPRACLTETDAKRGYRYLKLMKSFPKEWNGKEGKQIKEKLKHSKFVHRNLFLYEKLNDADGIVRQSFIMDLGRRGDIGAIDLLIQAMKKYEFGRRFAVEALGRIVDKRAVEPLIWALEIDDKDPYVGVYAARALGEIGDVRAIKPLQKALGIKKWVALHLVTEALEKIEKGCAKILISAAKDETKEVGRYVEYSLDRFQGSRVVLPVDSGLKK